MSPRFGKMIHLCLLSSLSLIALGCGKQTYITKLSESGEALSESIENSPNDGSIDQTVDPVPLGLPSNEEPSAGSPSPLPSSLPCPNGSPGSCPSCGNDDDGEDSNQSPKLPVTSILIHITEIDAVLMKDEDSPKELKVLEKKDRVIDLVDFLQNTLSYLNGNPELKGRKVLKVFIRAAETGHQVMAGETQICLSELRMKKGSKLHGIQLSIAAPLEIGSEQTSELSPEIKNLSNLIHVLGGDQNRCRLRHSYEILAKP